MSIPEAVPMLTTAKTVLVVVLAGFTIVVVELLVLPSARAPEASCGPGAHDSSDAWARPHWARQKALWGMEDLPERQGPQIGDTQRSARHPLLQP